MSTLEILEAETSSDQLPAKTDTAMSVLTLATPGAHNHLHRAAMLCTAQAACYIVLAGFALQAQKKQCGHGKWTPWVEANCEFDERTARRYMAVADGVKNKALKEAAKSFDPHFLELLSRPVHTLAAVEQKELLGVVQKLTDGQTLQQLYLDFGIVKTPQGGAGKGGNKGGSKPDGDEEDTAEQKAIDLWAPLLRSLQVDGLEEKSWVDLPNTGPVSRETLQGLLIDVSKLLREAQPAKGKGAAK